jgi:MFS family permease
MSRAIEELGAAERVTAPPRFYYGWVNVVVAAVAMSATLPGRTYGLGLIKEPLRADLGIGDLRFNVLNSLAVVIGAVFVLPVGLLIDRFGTRVVLTGVAAALGGSVLLMSRVADFAELAVTMTLVRGRGQGALSVVAIALVGKWFRRRAAMAMGVFTVLLGVGFIGPIFAVGEAVKASGWRAAWDGVGYALLFGLAPLGWLIARSSPESYGVPPDEPATDDGAGRPSMTLGQALSTPAFWVYTAAATLFNLTFSALTLDNESLLREHGLDGAKVNGTIMGVLMFTGLPVNILTGWLARRVALGKLLAVGVLILAASMAVFPSVTSVGAAVGYAALLGAAGGVTTVVYFAIYGHTYGRAHLGAIQAVVQILSVLASATGPVVLAAVREYGPSDPFFYGFAAIAVVFAVGSWVVRPPVLIPTEEGKV